MKKNKIILASEKSKEAVGEDTLLNVVMESTPKLVEDLDVKGIVDTYEVYEKERDNCTLYRLVVTIDPVCSNVLFNPKTIILDDSGNRIEDTNATTTNATNLIYNSKKNYTYYCGYDVFDNVFFRTDLFKRAKKLDETRVIAGTSDKKIHVFKLDDIKSYPNTINDVLTEQNGWIGFKNPGKLSVAKKDGTFDSEYSSFLGDTKTCDLIEMFPGKDMFLFNPINKTDGGLEYNWKYLITYPYQSYYDHWLTQDKDGVAGIPVMYAITYAAGDIGNIFAMPVVKLQTAYNNNLIQNDTVNIIKEGDTTGSGIDYRVLKTVDNTTFYIANPDGTLTSDSFKTTRLRKRSMGVLCDYYMRKFRRLPNWNFQKKEVTADNFEDRLNGNTDNVNKDFTSTLYPVAYSKTIFGDPVSQILFFDSLDIKFLKDNLGRPLTELYLTVIKNNDTSTQFQKYWGKISSGFPLTDIEGGNLYFPASATAGTDNLFRQNYPSIFYLHNLNDNAKSKNTNILPYNISIDGLVKDSNYSDYQPKLTFPLSPNPMENDNDITAAKEFMGDIVEFNTMSVTETVLAPIMYRFNTVSRESFNFKDRVIVFHEIFQDDWDRGTKDDGSTNLTTEYNAQNGNGAVNKKPTADDDDCAGLYSQSNSSFIYRGLIDAGPRPEGYMYQPHNRIELKKFSNTIRQKSFKRIYIDSIVRNHPTANDKLHFITTKPHSLYKESLVRITISQIRFDKIFKVNIDVNDPRKFTIPYDGKITPSSDPNVLKTFEVREYDYDTPAYATYIGNGRYIWRDILKEGVIEDFEREYIEHPFTNGNIYLHENFKFFLKRQGENLLYTDFPNDIYPETFNMDAANYEESNNVC
jgi:hypothetical protein